MTLRRRLITLAFASLAAVSAIESQGAPQQSSDSAEAFAERICKHILAALLREGHETVIGALPTLFGRVKERPA